MLSLTQYTVVQPDLEHLQTADIGEQLARGLEHATGERHPVTRQDPGPDQAKLLRLVNKLYRDGLETSWEERRKRALNLSFYVDKQWVGWDYQNRRLNNSPRRTDPNESKYLQQYNVFKPAIDTAVSRLGGANLVGRLDPGSSDQAAIDAARVAEHVLTEYEWNRLGVKNRVVETYKGMFLFGSFYWKVEWDPSSGKVIGRRPVYALGADGQPLMQPGAAPDPREEINPATGETVLVQDEPPMEPVIEREEDVHEGNIRLGLVLPDDIVLDPSALSIEEAGWVMHVCERTPSWVWREYKKLVGVSHSDTGVTTYSRRPSMSPSKTTRVMELWIRPGVYAYGDEPHEVLNLERGWIVVATPDDILDSGPNFYDHQEFPFVHFRCLYVPGQYDGDTPANSLRAAQVQLNTLLTQIAMGTALCANPQTLLPHGADVPEADRTNRPGAWIRFNPGPNGANTPRRLEGANLASGVWEFVSQLQNVFIPGLMAQHEGGAVGGAPPNVEAAAAFEALESKDLARLAPIAEEMVRGVERYFWLALRIIKQFWTLPRAVTVTGSLMTSEAMEFVGSDVYETFRPYVVPESALPQSKAVRFQKNFTLFQAGLQGPRDTLRNIGKDPSDEPSLADYDSSNARDENRQARTAGVINTLEELMRLQDHELHIEEHKRQLFDPGFTPERYPEGWLALYMHVAAHSMMLDEQMAAAMAQQAAMNAPPGEEPAAGGSSPGGEEPPASAPPADNSGAEQLIA